MSRPRTVKPGETEKRRAGDPPPEPGTYQARRAKGMLRAQERLTAEEMADGMRFTRAQLRVLDAIAAGLPVKGAREAMAALSLKATFAIQKPSTNIDHRVVSYTLVNPYADDPSELPERPARPALTPAAVLEAVLLSVPSDDDEGEDRE